MKSEERHHLEQNELAAWLVNYGTMIRPHLRLIGLVTFVVVVAVCAYNYVAGSAQQQQAEGWQDYFRAEKADDLDDVVEVSSRLI